MSSAIICAYVVLDLPICSISWLGNSTGREHNIPNFILESK